MKLSVITPVGPGHQEVVKNAMRSVAFLRSGPFSAIRHVIIDDGEGRLGRSRARNLGMETAADWFFFLDADDLMLRHATVMVDFDAPATFGTILLSGKPSRANVFPCGWPEIATHGARGTLSMGFFVKAEVARALRFNEKLDAGEDFDFYMRLPSFTKVDRPLVDIGYNTPSAGGPRGYRDIDWTKICNDVIASYIAADRSKFDLGDNAVLAAARDAQAQPGAIPDAVPV